jgi:pheromone shutdown protein TraB
MEAYEAVRTLQPTDLAIELDIDRFKFLNSRCASCIERESCYGRCEFIGATDALGNVDANIWLIDMSEEQIRRRIKQHSQPTWFWRFSFTGFPFWHPQGTDEVDLWEKGYKNEVMDRHTRRLKALRTKSPHLWRVLIDERNALMSARLAWLVSLKLKKEQAVQVLALTGAAHIDGIRKFLDHPTSIGEELRNLKLKFTTPQLIKRVNVN